MLTRRRFSISLAATAGSVALMRRPARAANDELRVAFIPESGATPEQLAAREPLVAMLEKATSRRVKLLVTTSYAATVEAIGNDGVDLAYLGGLTYVKAHDRYGVRPIVQREEDKQYHSLFIASASEPNLNGLAGLKGKRFAFGDPNSTSGHLIPVREMVDAHLDPDKDLATRFTGNHPATAQAVASGAVDAGALDEGIYHKLVAEKTLEPAKARVFFTSRPFVDYVWSTSKALDSKLVAQITHGFYTANPALLSVLRAKRFVAANDGEYDAIRVVAKRVGLL